ncbi:MAG TPA: BlaI/MecI/CopY family transcriptional regulator [Jatrophihabitantaceae bacterium]|jgi:predicted transcriptional regulator|nr:BlaI/MecI/CopY family transcriptional regulator [Jatrophihabitantaceae bacterium]
MARSRPRPRGSLEAEVLACLAAAGRGLTPAEVQADLGDDLAYTTVMTTLSRLHGKGALERNPDGRAYRYRLVGGADGARSNMTAHQMLRLLDEQDDHAGVLTRFVAELSAEDERVLTRLLGAAAASDAAGPRRRATHGRSAHGRSTRGRAAP